MPAPLSNKAHAQPRDGSQAPAPPELPPHANEGWIGPIALEGLPQDKTPPMGTLMIYEGAVDDAGIDPTGKIWLKLPDGSTKADQDFWAALA